MVKQQNEMQDREALYKRHEEITKEMTALYIRKNKDYGNSFGDMFQELGIITAITRIGDKFNRIKSFVKNKTYLVKDESVVDTLLDMANYCIMTVIELERTKAAIDSTAKEIAEEIKGKKEPVIIDVSETLIPFKIQKDDYEEMSIAELIQECITKGFNINRKSYKAQYYIKLLRGDDNIEDE